MMCRAWYAVQCGCGDLTAYETITSPRFTGIRSDRMDKNYERKGNDFCRHRIFFSTKN
jgi:hypothetical protein